jgi:hypothetical protein
MIGAIIPEHTTIPTIRINIQKENPNSRDNFFRVLKNGTIKKHPNNANTNHKK